MGAVIPPPTTGLSSSVGVTSEDVGAFSRYDIIGSMRAGRVQHLGSGLPAEIAHVDKRLAP